MSGQSRADGVMHHVYPILQGRRRRIRSQTKKEGATAIGVGVACVCMSMREFRDTMQVQARPAEQPLLGMAGLLWQGMQVLNDAVGKP